MPKTLSEIKKQGWDALVKKLGLSGATMFIMEHEEGSGDYTEERKKIFAEKSVDEITREIRVLKSKPKVKGKNQ
ncbi:MAG: hypothetical protein COT35_13090 [Nitrospirae bacterium CG08_land_8_20_14_0_20_52_24]|nr:MAG: hypothetical protein COT35_13090 [Nitrospirae bacterium CG08_land_8_20_14_0_20_52_24]PIV82828.1 MAG: hypothetical protein COW52_11680 [Nitrospirae bacterium CG17_big_fil_post_rev_8_21_14_2_50_50_9]